MPIRLELGDELHCLEGALREKKKQTKIVSARPEILCLDRYPLYRERYT